MAFWVVKLLQWLIWYIKVLWLGSHKLFFLSPPFLPLTSSFFLFPPSFFPFLFFFPLYTQLYTGLQKSKIKYFQNLFPFPYTATNFHGIWENILVSFLVTGEVVPLQGMMFTLPSTEWRLIEAYDDENEKNCLLEQSKSHPALPGKTVSTNAGFDGVSNDGRHNIKHYLSIHMPFYYWWGW